MDRPCSTEEATPGWCPNPPQPTPNSCPGHYGDNSGQLSVTLTIGSATAPDCDGNGLRDACEELDASNDCDNNGRLDTCDILECSGDWHCADCDGNGVPDGCEGADCNANGVSDLCEIRDNPALDVNEDGVLDACQQADCDGDTVPDALEKDLFVGTRSSGQGAHVYRYLGGQSWEDLTPYGFGGSPGDDRGAQTDVVFDLAVYRHALYAAVRRLGHGEIWVQDRALPSQWRNLTPRDADGISLLRGEARVLEIMDRRLHLAGNFIDKLFTCAQCRPEAPDWSIITTIADDVRSGLATRVCGRRPARSWWTGPCLFPLMRQGIAANPRKLAEFS